MPWLSRRKTPNVVLKFMNIKVIITLTRMKLTNGMSRNALPYPESVCLSVSGFSPGRAWGLVSGNTKITIEAAVKLIIASTMKSSIYDFAISSPAMAGAIITERLNTTRIIPYPSERLFSGRRSATTDRCAGPPMLDNVPTITDIAMNISNVGANAMPRALIDERIKLEMITFLRPIRSVNAPPITPPIKPETENMANNTPTVAIPMPNFWVRYKAKNGYNMKPPSWSMNTITL